MKEETKHMKLAYWTELVKEANNSGMKIQDWCKMNNITRRQYYYWHTKVMKSTYALVVTNGLLPDTRKCASDREMPEIPDFAQILIPDENTAGSGADLRKDSGIKIRWEGFSIDIDTEFSEGELLKVLRVVHNVK